MKVKELYSDASKWTKEWYAKDANGDWTDTSSEEACSFCLEGAMLKCYRYDENLEAIRDRVMEKIQENDPHMRAIAQWNDATSRTFQDVKDLVEALDI